MELYLFRWRIQQQQPFDFLELERVTGDVLERCISGSDVSIVRVGVNDTDLEILCQGDKGTIIGLMAQYRQNLEHEFPVERFLSKKFELLPLHCIG